MIHNVRRAFGAAVVVCAAALAGCASQTLKGNEIYKDQPGFSIADEAEIPDNDKNRQILDVVIDYRNAVAKQNFGTLRTLVSEDYYANAGTTDTTQDDYGSGKLPEIFEMLANHADQIRYKVTVRGIEYERERAMVDLEYEYAYKYQVGDKPTWDAGVEVNRLELAPEDGRWKIVSGL